MYDRDEYYDAYGNCRRCSSRDYGSTFDPRHYSNGDRYLVINRHRVSEDGGRCEACDEWCVEYRIVFTVSEGGTVIATVPSLHTAEAVIKAEAPGACYQRDHAWESERRLRQMEGWE